MQCRDGDMTAHAAGRKLLLLYSLLRLVLRLHRRVAVRRRSRTLSRFIGFRAMQGMGLLTSGITKVVSVLALGFGPKSEIYGYGGLGE